MFSSIGPVELIVVLAIALMVLMGNPLPAAARNAKMRSGTSLLSSPARTLPSPRQCDRPKGVSRRAISRDPRTAEGQTN
jgi:hypothetical protein